MTIHDTENGSKHEIKPIGANLYEVAYYEFYTACGWRKIGSTEVYTKECAEWEFGITL